MKLNSENAQNMEIRSTDHNVNSTKYFFNSVEDCVSTNTDRKSSKISNLSSADSMSQASCKQRRLRCFTQTLQAAIQTYCLECPSFHVRNFGNNH